MITELLYYLENIRENSIKRGFSKRLIHRISELQQYQIRFADL